MRENKRFVQQMQADLIAMLVVSLFISVTVLVSAL